MPIVARLRLMTLAVPHCHSATGSDRRSESAPKDFRRELKSQPRQQLDCRGTAAAVCRVGRRTQELRFISAGCNHWRPGSAGGSSRRVAQTSWQQQQQLRCLVRRLIHRSAGQPWLAATPWTGAGSAAATLTATVACTVQRNKLKRYTGRFDITTTYRHTAKRSARRVHGRHICQGNQ
jgi:hypothetical protein